MKARLCPALLVLALAYWGWLAPTPAGAQVLSGTYTGDGLDNRAITGLGFQPDVVIIKGNTAQAAVVRTSTMSGDGTKPFGGTALTANLVQSLDSGGFTIGSDARVNQSGIAYYWTAFKAAAGEMTVGSYTGNGVDNRSITGVGFQPDYAIVMSAGGSQPVQRSSSMVGDVSFRFDGVAGTANWIQALEADGFQVGTDARVNGNGTVYHYAAWKAVAGKMNVGPYVGNGVDNTNITGLGFQPEYVIIKQNGTQSTVSHPGSLGAATDSTLNFTATANATNRIQALQADGFQIGTNAQVNTSAVTYFWMAWSFRCGTLGEASYVAANVQSGQTTATVYWSSSQPVIILRKAGSFAGEGPANGTSYSVGNTIGAATVVYNDSAPASSFTDSGPLSTSSQESTRYYYKVFTKGSSTRPCYSAGTDVNASPPSGSHPAWGYMLAGGSILKGGTAGNSTLYISSNANRIVSLSAANGTQSWDPVNTTANIQGWLTWITAAGGIQSVQTGTVTMSTPTQTALGYTPKNPNRSFVVCSSQTNSSNESLRVTCELSNSAMTITGADANASQTVRWYVAEFGAGVSVQRGLATFQTTDATVNVPIAAVNPSMSFVLISERTCAGCVSQTVDEQWTIRAQLTSSTNLELSRNATGTIPVTVAWQVVQMSAASVQRGLTTMAVGEATKPQPISPVTPGSSFLLFTRRGDAGTGGVESEYQVRGELTNSTTLTFTRQASTTSIDIAWEVVSMSDGTWVQRGVASSDTTDNPLNATLSPPIDTTWSIPLISVSRGVAGGTTADLDSTSWTGTITSSTNIRMQRISSVDAQAQIAWQVVNFVQTSATAGATVIGGDLGTGAPDTGRVYSVDTTLGTKNWEVALTGADAVLAPASVQVRSFSDATFQAAYTDDVIFVATRNSSTTNNRVVALRASDGAELWTVTGTMDAVVGQPYVDYTRDRLYIASRAGSGGSQQSLWVINTLNGTLVVCPACSSLGHLETSPTLSYDGGTIYVGDTAGNLYAINTSTLALKWTASLGAGVVVNEFVWEDPNTAGRLYFSTADGNVRSMQDNGSGATSVWATPVAGPATPVLLDRLYVGSTDGTLHQLNLTTGVDEKQFTVGDGTKAVGDASTETGNEVFVGTTEGKIYKLPLPLP